MTDQRIIDYIKKGMQAGHSAASLKHSLMQQGWKEADIDQAVQIAQGQSKTQGPTQTTKTGGSSNRKLIIIIVVIVIFATVGITVIIGAGLFAMGALNPATFLRNRCNGFQYFIYSDHQIKNSEFTIVLENGVNDIQIQSIRVGSVTSDNPEVSSGISSDVSVSAEEYFTVKMGGLSLPSGDYDDLAVTVTYDVDGGIVGNTDTATCVGTVE